MKPTALDTSVVMRLVIREPWHQYKSAVALLEEAKASREPLWVGDLVLAEAYYALQFHYGFSKADALAALHRVSEDLGISVSSSARDVLALPGLATARPGFADRLIHGEGHAQGRELATFESAARHLPETRVLSGAEPG